jgi:type VI secretion system VasD/TssJ family lipoprotein
MRRPELQPTALPLAMLFLIFMAAACGSKDSESLAPPAPPPVEMDKLVWTYAPGAIKIGLIADEDMNQTNGVPTGLSVCIYQLSDNAWFQANAAAQGLSELLLCTATKPGQVSAGRYLIQPGQRQDLVLDRLEGTKYVAVAAGYSTMPAQGATAFLIVPVHENSKLFFANTYEIQTFQAWLLLKTQALQFFPKSEADLNRSAAPPPPKQTQTKDEYQSPLPPDRPTLRSVNQLPLKTIPDIPRNKDGLINPEAIK